MALLNALFEANTLKELLQICNDVYTKEAVEALSDLFSGTNPSLREVCDAAVEYCKASSSLLDDNVYLLTAPNGKQYVGQTTNMRSRIKNYKICRGSNEHLTRALKKYVFVNFMFQHHPIPTACADIIEKFMIRWYDLMNSEKGYNKTSGGKNGLVMSIETREKMRLAHIDIPLSDEHIAAQKAWWTLERKKEKGMMNATNENHPMRGKYGENNPNFGSKRSKHTREKMSLSQTGINNPNANPVVVSGMLFCSASDASKKKFINNNKKYVAVFIRRNPNSTEMFKVSKDFYKYCKNNYIEIITREMFDTFIQVQRVS